LSHASDYSQRRREVTPSIVACELPVRVPSPSARLILLDPLQDNETTQHLIVIHCYERERPPPKELAEHIAQFDIMYPRIKVTFLAVEAPFSPATIEWLSMELAIPKVW
jgi:hypothetical protein